MPPDCRFNRFVVLHHAVGASLDRTTESHFDWMFEFHGSLRTFATSVIESLGSGESASGIGLPDGVIEVDAQSLADHRTEYLKFEGEISGDRGRVHRVIAGTFECHKNSENEFIARITWQDQRGSRQAEAAFHRRLSDDLLFNVNRDAWRLRLTA